MQFFLYVTDVAEAFYLASMTNKVGCIWNLGSGNPQSVKKLIQLLNPKKTIRKLLIFIYNHTIY